MPGKKLNSPVNSNKKFREDVIIMTRRFKLVSVVLCLVLLASIFAACGAAPAAPATSGTSTSASTAASTSTATTPAVKAEISYLAWYNNETEIPSTQKVLDTFNGSQDKITVKLISVPYNDYDTKLNTMLSANTLPDTAMLREPLVTKWAKEGALADLSSMYDPADAPLKSLAFTYNGKVVSYSCADEVLLLYYNKDLFDKAGVAYPPASADQAWTWQQFVDAAKKLTKDANGKTPNDAGFDPKNITNYGAFFNTVDWMWPALAISNGGGIVSQDGKQFLFNKPETIEAAQAIADLNLKDHVAPTPATYSATALDVSLLTGKVAMATSGQWEIAVSIANSIKNGLHYGVGVLPKMKTPVTLNTGGANVIFNASKNLEASKTFIKWYLNEDNNMPNITSGLWMPISQKWYTDESLMKKWADNPAHPAFDQYKTAVIDYAMNNAQQVPWYFLPGYDKMEEVYGPGMDPVWAGTKTAKEAIDGMTPQMQQIFDENKIQ